MMKYVPRSLVSKPEKDLTHTTKAEVKCTPINTLITTQYVNKEQTLNQIRELLRLQAISNRAFRPKKSQ